MATSTFTQPLSSENSQFIVQCCFTSTETVQTIRDRIATSTFTQLLSSELQPNSKDRKPFTTCFFNHCHNLLMPQASNGSKFVTKQAAQITSGSYIRLPAQIITQIIQIKTTFFYPGRTQPDVYVCASMLCCFHSCHKMYGGYLQHETYSSDFSWQMHRDNQCSLSSVP